MLYNFTVAFATEQSAGRIDRMIRIYADSTNDLGPELIKKHDIRIVPLYVRMGDTTVRDGAELDVEAMYEWADRMKTTPQTSAFSPADAEDAVLEAKNAGDDVLFFGISSDMSSSCSSFRIAAEDLEWSDHTFIVDSRNLSSGIALLILKAAKSVEKGDKTAAEIWLEMQDLIPRVRASFVVDTLLYLWRGGRCGAVSALAASALGIKPKIVVENGKMGVGHKYRGRLDKVIEKYVADLAPQLKKADPDAVFITHSGVDPRIVDSVRKKLEDCKKFDSIIETRAGGVISSHCGPGTLGVLFIEND